VEHLGLVGLPRSGRSTLFDALTGLVERDPSARTETVVGIAHVPDDRLDRLAAMSRSKKVVPAGFEVVDIAAKGATPGAGLGKAFLGSLRDCDAILYVLGAFEPGSDPAAALAELEIELALTDLQSVEQRLERQRRAMKGDKTVATEVAALDRAMAVLGEGQPVYRSDLAEADRALLAPVFLLTNKPVLMVVNIGEDQLAAADEIAAGLGPDPLAVCLAIEAEIAACAPDDRPEMLESFGISESVLPRLARAAYHLLGRRTFFTTGDKESRAWTVRVGATAPECAGVIHSDLQRGFIRAEIIRWDELLEIGSWTKAKELGKLRVEGKDYEVADGDVLEIRFNV
jgi:ribosome-binding ATPase